MKLSQTDSTKKTLYIEALRILACFLVIFNHTDGYAEYMNQVPGSFLYWLFLVMSICSKSAIYIFLSISGALLLGKNEPLKKIWMVRIPRIFVGLLIFSLGYYLSDVSCGREVFNVGNFIRVLFHQGWIVPFWYLYAYIGFLMIIPMLRPLVQNMDNKVFIYWIILYFVFTGIMPILQRIIPDFGLNGYISSISGFAELLIVYPCLGYFLCNKLDISKVKGLYILIGLFSVVAFQIYSAYLTYSSSVQTGNFEVNEQYFATYQLITVIVLFISFRKYIKDKENYNKFGEFVLSLGGCTYGIYLIHPFLLERIRIVTKLFDMIKEKIAFLGNMAVDIIYIIGIMMLAYAIVWVMKKIPLVNKIV